MTEIIDKSYFTALAGADQEVLCRSGRCTYLADQRQYLLEVWGERYLIDPAKASIARTIATKPPPHQYFNLFVIYYLLLANDIILTGQWVSEKDAAGGPTFFRGPHQIPTDLIGKRFDDDLHAFRSRCLKLGGTPLEMADAAYSFSITADIPVAVLYWLGDEDFPTGAKLLFDRSAITLLPLDIVFALAVGVCARIGARNSA